jgi:hypothetical protein
MTVDVKGHVPVDEEEESMRRLISDLRQIWNNVQDASISLTREHYRLGKRIITDPKYGRYSRGMVEYKRRISQDLGCSISTVENAIKFANYVDEKFPKNTIEDFIMHYGSELAEKHWNWVVMELLPVHEEPRDLVSWIRRMIDNRFSDRDEREVLYNCARAIGFKTEYDVNYVADEIEKWRNGQKIYTFNKEIVLTDMPFEDAAPKIAAFAMHQRYLKPLRGIVYEELERVHNLAKEAKRNNPILYGYVPDDLEDFSILCTWESLFTWHIRLSARGTNIAE